MPDTPPETVIWFLATCQACTPVLPQPFTDEERRDQWADAHWTGTGHVVTRAIERRVKPAEIPPGQYARGGRSLIVWVFLCPPCGGYAPITDEDYSGYLSGRCSGCGAAARELHRFRAFIHSAEPCGCTSMHQRVSGDLAAEPAVAVPDLASAERPHHLPGDPPHPYCIEHDQPLDWCKPPHALRSPADLMAMQGVPPDLAHILKMSLRAAADLASLTPEQMLREFHAAGGFVLPDRPTLDLSADRFTSDAKRQAMLESEVGELRGAVAARDLVAIADALADIIYVAYGTGVTYGLPMDAVVGEVHRSNMTKYVGGPVIDGDGKIVKGPHYEPPRIAELLGGADLASGTTDGPAQGPVWVGPGDANAADTAVAQEVAAGLRCESPFCSVSPEPHLRRAGCPGSGTADGGA